MQDVKTFDELRAYTCRCPSCKRFRNISGSSLNNETYIKCWLCGAKSRTQNWTKDSDIYDRRFDNALFR